MHALFLIAFALPLLLALRLYLVLPPLPPPKRSPGETCSFGVFLGSGGHTAEMKALLSDIDFKRYSPRVYVFCPGDDMSLQLVAELEESRASQSESYSLLPLPRARKVAEPLLSTLISSLQTLCVAVRDVFLFPLLRHPGRPWVDVLLLNGPGTCVVLVLACYIRRFFGLSYTRIIYVESFARVHSLSLSGKLLRPFVDSFVVQWPGAADRATPDKADAGRGTTYRGWLV